MNVRPFGTFKRDVDDVSKKEVVEALKFKYEQLEKAKGIENITGLKLLRGYATQYRIKVVSKKYSYRIGATIRGNTIWLVRFLSRKKIYQEFP